MSPWQPCLSSGPLLCACPLPHPQQDLLLSALVLTLKWAHTAAPENKEFPPRLLMLSSRHWSWPIPSACPASSGCFFIKSCDSARWSQAHGGLKQEPRLCLTLCSSAPFWPSSTCLDRCLPTSHVSKSQPPGVQAEGWT